MKNEASRPSSSPFNSPLECGLRSLILLVEAFPDTLDVQRLIQYDYLLVHSGDAPGGPESLHPNTPNRSGELLVRRELVIAGLRLMLSKGLLVVKYSKKGIAYGASDDAAAFVDVLGSSYIEKLRDRAVWVVNEFKKFSNDGLNKFMRENWDHWGTEFVDGQGHLFEASDYERI